MENFVIKGNKAFLDSVASGTPLKTPNQAQIWLDSLKDKEITTLYILTSGEKYYKIETDIPIKACTKVQFDAEFINFTAADKIENHKIEALSIKENLIEQNVQSFDQEQIYQKVYKTVYIAAKQAISDLFSKILQP